MALRCNGLEDGRLVGQEREWENFPEQTGDGVLAFLDPTMECLYLSTCLTSFLSLLISPSPLRSSWSLHCYKGKDRKPKFPSLELTLWCWTTLNRMYLPRQDLKSRGWKYDLVKGLPEAWEPELRPPGPSKAKCGSMTVIFFFFFFFFMTVILMLLLQDGVRAEQNLFKLTGHLAWQTQGWTRRRHRLKVRLTMQVCPLNTIYTWRHIHTRSKIIRRRITIQWIPRKAYFWTRSRL